MKSSVSVQTVTLVSALSYKGGIHLTSLSHLVGAAASEACGSVMWIGDLLTCG